MSVVVFDGFDMFPESVVVAAAGMAETSTSAKAPHESLHGFETLFDDELPGDREAAWGLAGVNLDQLLADFE